MKHWKLKHLALAALVAGSAVVLAGCEAQGDAALDGIEDGAPLFPNDGTTPTQVTETQNGIPTPIGDGLGFVCERGVGAVSNNAETFVTANGLLGNGLLGPLLEGLGGIPVNTLLSSVAEPNNLIDAKLRTFSTFALTLDALSLLSTVDQVVTFNQQVSAGHYAVFGLRFPAGLLEASLFNQVVVRTFLGGVQQEVAVLSQEAVIDLLALPAFSTDFNRIFFGLKTTKDFDAVTLGLSPFLLSANVGEAMYGHELCLEGSFK